MFWRRRSADASPEAEADPEPEARRHPRRVLLLSLVILLLLFVGTSFAARFYHAQQASLAQQWFERGEGQLKAGQAQTALEDFRNALSYSPDNKLFEYRLAQALVAADRLVEAESYLLALAEKTPGSGPINLELARLEAGKGRTELALRYYQSAIDGIWETNTPAHRRQTQLELCQFLLAQKQVRQAQAELLALAANTPPEDVSMRMEVADLLLATGDQRGALAQYRQVLSRQPRNAAALAGAGQAAFETGDFRQARDDVRLAVEQNRADTQSKQRLDIAGFILENDPFQVGLTDRARAGRLRLDLAQALYRLKQCAGSLNQSLAVPAPQTALQSAYADALKFQPQMRARSFERDPKAMAQAMDLILRIEELARASCGPLPPEDEALRIIGQRSQQSHP
jgi:tetratricopeptide (TPR) repeat protein